MNPRRVSDGGRRLHRRGSALLEVIVALTVFAIAGVSLLELTVEAGHAVARSRGAVHELLSANAFLESVALWPRSDLDRHLGTHREGMFDLTVNRPTLTLYVVVLENRANQSTDSRVVLETTLYRELP